MRLYEFEAKEIFKDCDIPIPRGKIAKTLPKAKKIEQVIEKPVSIKVQVLWGKKGKS